MMRIQTVTLPLGMSKFSYGAHADNRQEELLLLHEVLGKCNSMTFSVKRFSEKCISVDIVYRNVPEARGGQIDKLEDSFAGLVGDTIQLLNGRRVSIDGCENNEVTLSFHKKS